jgi:hypothetical protein
MPYASVYNVALSVDQAVALSTAMSGGTYASKTLSYAGTWPAYPQIVIHGPITNPVLTNVSTGKVLAFTATIADGTFYSIDTRYGYKTVVDSAGVNRLGNLSAASDLAEFALLPAPDVAAGANAFTLSGTSTGANTKVVVRYNNRYGGI